MHLETATGQCDQEYNIQRSDSVTKSPPTKRAKENHSEPMDMEPHAGEKLKDKEIAELKALVVDLQQQLKLEKTHRENRETKPETYYPKVMVTQFSQEEDNTKSTKEVEQPLPCIGNAKPNPISLAEKTVSICKHRDEIVVEEMPQYQFVCERCGKGFTHKNNLLRHKEEHNAPTNSSNQPKPSASNQSRERPQDKDNVYKHNKFQFKFNFLDIHSCDQCDKVFDRKDKLDEHQVEHITTQEQVNVPEQHASLACVCVYPCIPKVTQDPISGPT